MKAKERHHLKENEFARTTARVTTAVIERRRQYGVAVVLIVLVLVVIGGIVGWRRAQAERGGAQLGAAMTIIESPIAPASSLPGASQAPGTFPTSQARSEAALKALQEVIAAHPSSNAALTATYEAAGQLLALGRTAEAEQMYRDVIAQNSEVYTTGARLGLAQALAAGGKYDDAIKAFNDVAAQTNTAVPVDGVLMHLGHTYVKAGKPQDAAAAYKRVTDEFPDSVYATDAKQRLAALN